jgi:thiopurine S-methyltransferase
VVTRGDLVENVGLSGNFDLAQDVPEQKSPGGSAPQSGGSPESDRRRIEYMDTNMDSQYWLQRWHDGRTGWHHDKPMPLLLEHWPGLDVPRDTRVLVPLCGKSLDMLWLAQQGLNVLGVELSEIAIETFLAENKLHARMHTASDGTHYEITTAQGGGIEIINGDVFEIDPASLAECNAFYDRAATIALPAPQRDRLAHDVYDKLPADARGLLITLAYPPHEMDGPPFPVNEAEVQRLFASNWKIEQLDRRDILASQPHFSEQGVTALHTAVYRLDKHPR